MPNAFRLDERVAVVTGLVTILATEQPVEDGG